MKILSAIIVFVFILTANTSSSAHEIFQDVMKKKYTLKSFSCKACHPTKDDRKQLTSFAKLIHEELKEKKYSEKFATAEAAGDEAVAAFEKVIAKDFEKAIKTVGQKQMTFDELIKAGLFSGARLDTKKLESMKTDQ